MEFVADGAEAGFRIDQFLARRLADRFSRSQVKKLIESGGVRAGGHSVT